MHLGTEFERDGHFARREVALYCATGLGTKPISRRADCYVSTRSGKIASVIQAPVSNGSGVKKTKTAAHNFVRSRSFGKLAFHQ